MRKITNLTQSWYNSNKFLYRKKGYFWDSIGPSRIVHGIKVLMGKNKNLDR